MFASALGKITGKLVSGKQHNAIYVLGFSRILHNIRHFKALMALDNVRVACHTNTKSRLYDALFFTDRHRTEEDRIYNRAMEFLKVMGLSHRAHEVSRNLPYGEQRRLEIARALATRPRVLCLDEPAAGMNAAEKLDLQKLIREIRDRFKVAILVIEHDMRLAMTVAERMVVLDHGVTIAAATPDVIRKDPKVIEAYLGDSYLEEGHRKSVTGEEG